MRAFAMPRFDVCFSKQRTYASLWRQVLSRSEAALDEPPPAVLAAPRRAEIWVTRWATELDIQPRDVRNNEQNQGLKG
jgi:hypothetical protein